MLDDGGSRYSNYSGCGNTINGNHPIVREMIFHCLRHWVHNYHIDGFRFDLASILSRDRDGNLVPNPPLVEAIAEDPLLADTKIIAEAWDAAGAYQVGSFGDRRAGPNGTAAIATTCAASGAATRACVGRSPRAWPVPATCTSPADAARTTASTSSPPTTASRSTTWSHYSDKHNEANGEDNRDGDNNNYQRNYGVEGPTRKGQIEEIRRRQIKNCLATLLLSQGVPMLALRRRMSPHPTRQQQRLLPGQRDFLVRLVVGGVKCGACAFLSGTHPIPSRPAIGAATFVPDRQSHARSSTGGCQLVRCGRNNGRVGWQQKRADLPAQSTHIPAGESR